MKEMDVINQFVRRWAANNEDTADALHSLAMWYLKIVSPVAGELTRVAQIVEGPNLAERHFWRMATEQPVQFGTYVDYRESDGWYFVHEFDQAFLDSGVEIAMPAMLLGPLDPELDGKPTPPSCSGVWVVWWKGTTPARILYKEDSIPETTPDAEARFYRLPAPKIY